MYFGIRGDERRETVGPRLGDDNAVERVAGPVLEKRSLNDRWKRVATSLQIDLAGKLMEKHLWRTNDAIDFEEVLQLQ